MELAESVGNNIRRARLDQGLTQKQLGKLAGMSQQHVGKLENGKVNLSLEDAVAFARALHCRVQDIAGVVERAKVPVVGQLSLHDLVVTVPEEAWEWVEAPPFATPDMRAVVVATDALWPVYRKGDTLFLRDPEPAAECIGEECALVLPTGRTVVKRVLSGSPERGWVLASVSGPGVLQVDSLSSCRRVDFIRRARRGPQPHHAALYRGEGDQPEVELVEPAEVTPPEPGSWPPSPAPLGERSREAPEGPAELANEAEAAALPASVLEDHPDPFSPETPPALPVKLGEAAAAR